MKLSSKNKNQGENKILNALYIKSLLPLPAIYYYI